MIEAVLRIREFADVVVRGAEHVSVDTDAARVLSKRLEEFKPGDLQEELTRDLVIEELVANSVNYCYWCGGHDLRPGGASANLMYKLLRQSATGDDAFSVLRVVEGLYREMVLRRFPLLAERRAHLQELVEGDGAEEFICAALDEDTDEAVEALMWKLPGYVSDVFLKRAQLLFMMLHRRTAAFGALVNHFTVPVDYQLPKVLRWAGVLIYDDELSRMVDRGELVPKHSKWEVEIRAATLVACDKLARMTGLTTCELDEALWGLRHEPSSPFHLTVTTDY